MGTGGAKWGEKGRLSLRGSSCLLVTFTRKTTMVPVKNMFLGEFQHILDSKGRLAIPAKFRSTLALGAVVTRGLDASLILFPLEEWGKVAQKVAALPLGQGDSRAFARLLLSGAYDVELDSQGRMVIPGSLRTWAHIQREVVVVGLYNRIEIWDKDTWEDVSQKAIEDLEGITERLSEFGI